MAELVPTVVGSLPRLSERTLPLLPPAVARPAYDRAATRLGVAHFGPGAFHRAHQAEVFDRILAADPRFAICDVSLRSDNVRAALQPQDGLYSLFEREAEPTVCVIGAVTRLLTAPKSPDAVRAILADSGVRFVTITVTEKGYGLTPEGDLDLATSVIRRDLERPAAPESLIGWIVEGLRLRRAAGARPFTTPSCDNLSGNGARLRQGVLQFAEAIGEHDLVAWIEGEARFPCTMVDSITPATDEILRVKAREVLGLEDAWPIQRERFTQWVIEDVLPQDGSILADAGVILAGDVALFERAKLRLLNGAHSALAYLGLLRGRTLVSDAMADPALAAFARAMMREEIAPSLKSAPGLDLQAYIGGVLTRFRNPAIEHHLGQIAWDGSQKLPIRLLGTIAEALAVGRPFDRLALAVAGWMAFVRERARAGAPITDPPADRLADIGRRCDGDPAHDVGLFLDLEAVFPRPLAADPRLRAALEQAYVRLRDPESALLAASHN
jgi:fructuronate reductase